MTRSSKLLLFTGLLALFSLSFVSPSCFGDVFQTAQDDVVLSVGVSPTVGLEVVSNEPGTGVSFSDGVYSKTMLNGEYLTSFATTTVKITCNIMSDSDSIVYSDHSCADDGYVLSVAPSASSTSTVDGVTYAAMKSSTSNAEIRSDSTDITDYDHSTWVMSVSTETKEYSGPMNTSSTISSTPTITSGFSTDHIVPGTSTAILTGNSFVTSNSKVYYLGPMQATFHYGVNVSQYQPAGVYSGVIVYTLAIRAN